MEAARGFFRRRRVLDLGPRVGGALPYGMVEYLNLPRTVATCISSRLATLHELDSVYGLEDMWWLLEVNTVDSHNTMIANQPRD